MPQEPPAYNAARVAQRPTRKRERVECSFKDCTFSGKTKKQTKEHEKSEHGTHKIRCPEPSCNFECTTADLFAKHYQTEHGQGSTAGTVRPKVEKKQPKSKVKSERHLPIPGFPRSWTPSIAASTSLMAPNDEDDGPLPVSSSLFGDPDPPMLGRHSRPRPYPFGSSGRSTGESSSKKAKLTSYPPPLFSGIRDWACMSVYLDGRRGCT